MASSAPIQCSSTMLQNIAQWIFIISDLPVIYETDKSDRLNINRRFR